VRVEHASGVVSIYAHLADYVVEVGQHIARGQLLGTVGRTGVQTSDAHLHFGLFDQGHVLDPLVHLDRYVLSVDRGTPLE
jgi:murein DD-endopeptidase MepM/ murein hydrolase activator NlpD